MLTWMRSLTELKLTVDEWALFTAAVLLCPDRADISNSEYVRINHKMIVEALHLYHACCDGTQAFSNDIIQAADEVDASV
ncbi:hypothetical protein EVAR_72054_1 [Eumeta japonica]|uniref:NR LBD domain-containing protein n=1 Tax=Eumeta variegata TaxID=151549 RepID=A0A4C1TD85_EUMVA|nr:hypothetical protein EVAR_72054_1 [Eumeta japonica]